MDQALYEKKIQKANEYRQRAIEKRLQKINSPEYKEKQRTKYLIALEKKKNTPVKSKPIKCKQATAKKGNGEYFSIFSVDMHRCVITGDTYNVVPHHIFGASHKAFSEKYGFVLPIRIDWHEGYDYSIHKNKELDLKYKKLCQDYWITTLGKTKKEWHNECGKWY